MARTPRTPRAQRFEANGSPMKSKKQKAAEESQAAAKAKKQQTKANIAAIEKAKDPTIKQTEKEKANKDAGTKSRAERKADRKAEFIKQTTATTPTTTVTAKVTLTAATAVEGALKVASLTAATTKRLSRADSEHTKTDSQITAEIDKIKAETTTQKAAITSSTTLSPEEKTKQIAELDAKQIEGVKVLTDYQSKIQTNLAEEKQRIEGNNTRFSISQNHKTIKGIDTQINLLKNKPNKTILEISILSDLEKQKQAIETGITEKKAKVSNLTVTTQKEIIETTNKLKNTQAEITSLESQRPLTPDQQSKLTTLEAQKKTIETDIADKQKIINSESAKKVVLNTLITANNKIRSDRKTKKNTNNVIVNTEKFNNLFNKIQKPIDPISGPKTEAESAAEKVELEAATAQQKINNNAYVAEAKRYATNLSSTNAVTPRQEKGKIGESQSTARKLLDFKYTEYVTKKNQKIKNLEHKLAIEGQQTRSGKAVGDQRSTLAKFFSTPIRNQLKKERRKLEMHDTKYRKNILDLRNEEAFNQKMEAKLVDKEASKMVKAEDLATEVRGRTLGAIAEGTLNISDAKALKQFKKNTKKNAKADLKETKKISTEENKALKQQLKNGQNALRRLKKLGIESSDLPPTN